MYFKVEDKFQEITFNARNSATICNMFNEETQVEGARITQITVSRGRVERSTR